MVIFASGDKRGLKVCDTERRSMVIFATGGDEKGLGVCDTERGYVVVFAKSFELSSGEVRVSRGGCFWSNLSRALAKVTRVIIASENSLGWVSFCFSLVFSGLTSVMPDGGLLINVSRGQE